MVGIAWQGDDDSMQEFVDRHGLTFPSASDDEGELFTRFRVPGQPAWVFVDASGTMETHLGALGPDELDAAFEQLIRSA